MEMAKHHRLLNFLREELLISDESVAIARRHPDSANHLPMILWQYGLVTLEQLDRIFDWLEAA
ncbi:MAG: DUF2949 domain-containing protein [Synechococcales bacterium]|nr:DUF2949 domain-containing protein [Synechococcales bacterium]